MHTHTQLEKLGQLSNRLIQGCISPAHDGTSLFTPDGIASYDGLWTRDFAYMVEYAGASIKDEQIIAAVDYIIGGRREDGWLPDRIYADGSAVYAAGVAGSPVGQANLDNTPFLVFVAHVLLNRMDAEQARSLFARWEPHLALGLDIIPLSKDGLVYNDPADPHSPYGFTDTIGKTGELFKESLLFWRSCVQLADLYAQFGDAADGSRFQYRASAVEQHLFKLYAPEHQAFWAASEDCRQLDIWGVAYLLYIGFPADAAKDELIAFLVQHYGDYVYKGQIRHLLKGEYWDRLLIDVPHETYQNGAYWATASGWVIWSLAQADAGLAARTVQDVMRSFEEDGVFECINEGYSKLDSFVVSATNVYGAVDRLVNKERHQAFIDALHAAGQE